MSNSANIGPTILTGLAAPSARIESFDSKGGDDSQAPFHDVMGKENHRQNPVLDRKAPLREPQAEPDTQSIEGGEPTENRPDAENIQTDSVEDFVAQESRPIPQELSDIRTNGVRIESDSPFIVTVKNGETLPLAAREGQIPPKLDALNPVVNPREIHPIVTEQIQTTAQTSLVSQTESNTQSINQSVLNQPVPQEPGNDIHVDGKSIVSSTVNIDQTQMNHPNANANGQTITSTLNVNDKTSTPLNVAQPIKLTAGVETEANQNGDLANELTSRTQTLLGEHVLSRRAKFLQQNGLGAQYGGGFEQFRNRSDLGPFVLPQSMENFLDNALAGKNLNAAGLEQAIDIHSTASKGSEPGSLIKLSSSIDQSWMQQLQNVQLASTQKAMPLSMQTPLHINNPNWFANMAERVSWLASQAIQAAEIQLDPPELGPLQVRIALNQDQASVNFVSQHSLVRDTLDSQLVRLKELFAQEGMNLVDVNVSDRHEQRQQEPQKQEPGIDGGLTEEAGLETNSKPLLAKINNWVDYYV